MSDIRAYLTRSEAVHEASQDARTFGTGFVFSQVYDDGTQWFYVLPPDQVLVLMPHEDHR